jgi:hypothetical protein
MTRELDPLDTAWRKLTPQQRRRRAAMDIEREEIAGREGRALRVGGCIP